MEILGGKHFKTPDGEFVEVKSGTQYKIHVKNSRPYGKVNINNNNNNNNNNFFLYLHSLIQELIIYLTNYSILIS